MPGKPAAAVLPSPAPRADCSYADTACPFLAMPGLGAVPRTEICLLQAPSSLLISCLCTKLTCGHIASLPTLNPAPAGQEEGSEVPERLGARFTNGAERRSRNRVPFVPDLPAPAITICELMHTPLPCDCSHPSYANTKIKARPTRRPAPLQVRVLSFYVNLPPIKKVNFEEGHSCYRGFPGLSHLSCCSW